MNFQTKDSLFMQCRLPAAQRTVRSHLPEYRAHFTIVLHTIEAMVSLRASTRIRNDLFAFSAFSCQLFADKCMHTMAIISMGIACISKCARAASLNGPPVAAHCIAPPKPVYEFPNAFGPYWKNVKRANEYAAAVGPKKTDFALWVLSR